MRLRILNLLPCHAILPFLTYMFISLGYLRSLSVTAASISFLIPGSFPRQLFSGHPNLGVDKTFRGDCVNKTIEILE